MSRTSHLLATVVLATAAASCRGDDASTATSDVETTTVPATAPAPPSNTSPAPTLVAAVDDGIFPDVVDVSAKEASDGTWTFDVTISSPYDSPQRYATRGESWRPTAPSWVPGNSPTITPASNRSPVRYRA